METLTGSGGRGNEIQVPLNDHFLSSVTNLCSRYLTVSTSPGITRDSGKRRRMSISVSLGLVESIERFPMSGKLTRSVEGTTGE